MRQIMDERKRIEEAFINRASADDDKCRQEKKERRRLVEALGLTEKELVSLFWEYGSDGLLLRLRSLEFEKRYFPAYRKKFRQFKKAA